MPMLTRASSALFATVFAALLLCTPGAWAQSSYTVEVLAFKQPTGRDTDPSLWAFDATPPAPANPEYATPSTPGALANVRSRLDGNGYTTVAHVAWQQSVRSQAEATPTAVPANGSGAGSLGGYLRVWRGRYLHIDADLHYMDNSGQNGGEQREARLRVSRKVAAGQPVYLDHELFGVVVYLRR